MTAIEKTHAARRVRKPVSEIVFDVIVITVLTVFTLCILLPFMNLVSISFSNETAIMAGRVKFSPAGFSLASYCKILHTSSILRAYGNTIFVAFMSCALSLLMTSVAAYPLAYGDFGGKKLYNLLIMFTMWFSGGMIPSFMVMRGLGLIDSLFSLILGSAIGAYNVLILTSFFRSISRSLVESAYLDGANDFKVLFRIVMPLSKAGLATIGLWVFVGHWNDYMGPLIYIKSIEKYPLQLILRELVLEASSSGSMLEMSEGNKGALPEQLKHAVIVFSMLPIMAAYPFVQKYFVKGVMLGSVKE